LRLRRLKRRRKSPLLLSKRKNRNKIKNKNNKLKSQKLQRKQRRSKKFQVMDRLFLKKKEKVPRELLPQVPIHQSLVT
jgi:hypothetical protein